MKPWLKRLLIAAWIFLFLFALLRIGTSTWENAVRAAASI